MIHLVILVLFSQTVQPEWSYAIGACLTGPNPERTSGPWWPNERGLPAHSSLHFFVAGKGDIEEEIISSEWLHWKWYRSLHSRCEPLDFDGDGDVDLRDVSLVWRYADPSDTQRAWANFLKLFDLTRGWDLFLPSHLGIFFDLQRAA